MNNCKPQNWLWNRSNYFWMLISVKLGYLLPPKLLVFILGDGFALWRFRPDDAVWHYDLSSDSQQTEPVCVLTWLTLTPSPSLSGWLFLYLAEQPCHWHSPTHECSYKQIQKDTFTYTHTNVFTYTQKTFRLDVVEDGSRQKAVELSIKLRFIFT